MNSELQAMEDGRRKNAQIRCNRVFVPAPSDSAIRAPKPNYALNKAQTAPSPEVRLAKHYLRTKIWTVQNCSCVSTVSYLAVAFASAGISEGRTRSYRGLSTPLFRRVGLTQVKFRC